MADKPIIFSGPMVRAILDGRKTQTRRVLKKQDWTAGIIQRWPRQKAGVPYQSGDRLWVREALKLDESDHLLYAVDEAPVPHDCIPVGFSVSRRSVPGMFMCRWASRLTLQVSAVKVERLQEISEEDALAEGIERLRFPDRGDWGWPQHRFRVLWDSPNAKRGHGWDSNPWVVAVTFKPYLCNIDKFSGLPPETAAKEADDAAES
jgi:hypothetical protein